MAAAYLESELGALLTQYFVDDRDVIESLVKGNGSLATFSARIDLAYALGLLSPMGRRDFHLIRRIRNEFAHRPQHISFDEEPIAARCRELHHDLWDEELPPRKKFMRVVMGAAALIHGRNRSLEHIPTMREIDLRTPEVQHQARQLRDAIDRLS